MQELGEEAFLGWGGWDRDRSSLGAGAISGGFLLHIPTPFREHAALHWLLGLPPAKQLADE